jgi:hypothetical protein
MIREVTIANHAKDWIEDLALFAVAYPGINVLDVTFAVFTAMLNVAQRSHIWVKGEITEQLDTQMKHSAAIGRDNRMILLKETFPHFFPEMAEDDG